MSAPDLAMPASASMSLGDLISPDAFVEEDVMADEVIEPVVAAPAEAPVKKPRKIPIKKAKAVVPVAETDENGEAATTGDVDTETPVKPKKPRKTPVKKEKAAIETGENEDAGSGDAEGEVPTTKVTPAKKPRKTPVKKENVKPKEEVSAKEGDDEEAEEPTTPKAVPKKRAAPKKKADATPATPVGAEDGDAEMATPGTSGKTPATKSTGKKRGPNKAADGETPTKKSKAGNGFPTAGKRAATKFPECWAEFTEEDKLLVTMKREGHKIGAIETAWTALTGRAPGTDSLRKRIPKLEAVAQDFDDSDVLKLVAAKKAVDADFVAIKEKMEVEQAAALKKMKTDQDNALKKQETEKWTKISEHILAAKGGDYKAFLIEKKWKALERDGEELTLPSFGNYVDINIGDIDSQGNYKGAIVAADDDEAADDEEAADDDMEENGDVDDEESPATNANGHLEEEVDAEAMEE
ncbi:hypothetical protein VTL71DRAFT_2240 [Oculimacula yallundae]|uniref:Uncharacterized protein n=1 Tax=Oculimacula yallundae TaxID=86028 RepID=A0ABR4CAB2_9HELO